jgi:hypothetical protein
LFLLNLVFIKYGFENDFIHLADCSRESFVCPPFWVLTYYIKLINHIVAGDHKKLKFW